jgi:hypothetical protein
MWHIGPLSSLEPARHALYAELEQVLGAKNAETLMTHLPQHTSDSVATKDDISHLNMRFDRMEDRMDKMQRNFLTVSFGTLTVMTAIFSFITRG